ncbi:L-serine ammonia-lyase, iron-sulfur-dependent, subunit alpha [Loigolactobacillus backii]|uniref:L-serine dehydratase n=1 Tax=Loigolactobacillus backii TaxID=375175 RepID=A0A192GYH1_9LACO|nr:L-serine ammonia-lyase, iron-sulfur-dependent, subunit alpha [Loigolactobacillus backii]ANK60858.1 serine dehydratase [Loigolactobacillus backii]ANK61569.1 serine dehydratase [Loigolactobacillus backii]ANK65811.1 serine dehydratase [Loigolactobacillus backii]ANK68287.1 serine dehydratase [Loigolactobacillus backii]ANK69233.1 serine dehydratase [Loigolactobacillus backii]
MFTSIEELVAAAVKQHVTLSDLMIEQEMQNTNSTKDEVWTAMERNLAVMADAVKKGASGEGVYSQTGLTGGEAVKLKKYRQSHHTLAGDTVLEAVQDAIATNEVNASMGVICATPTAGSSGTLPGVLFMLRKRLNLNHEQLVRFLFTAGAFGLIIANNAMIAGATGGCQAEVGSASAMAAAAAVEAAGGTPQQSAEALAMALSNLLGLVCDPVAGLVELPCVKRNAIGAGNALIAADMALAGLTNKIPADEVVAAMKKIGEDMPQTLRETGLGGLAATPTGIKMKMQIFGKSVDLGGV